MKKSAFTLLSFLFLSLNALYAHPGHGHTEPSSVGHYLSSPEHYIPLMFALLALVVFVVYRVVKAEKKQG